MTREEVVKELQGLHDDEAMQWDQSVPQCVALRAAIALLQPTPTEEIEAAWAAMSQWFLRSDERGRYSHVFDRALNALAREPGLEAEIQLATEQDTWLRGRIAALEARLARVREVVAQMPPDDACFACRAALAATAGLAAPFPDNRIFRPEPYPAEPPTGVTAPTKRLIMSNAKGDPK